MTEVFMTWLIYLIGIKQIILLMEIQNDFKICDFVWYIWGKEGETGG